MSLSVSAIEPAPTILVPPASVGAVAGKSVSFSVQAEGAPGGSALTYQWYFNDAPLPGAAAKKATYTVAVSAARAGFYRVVVGNAAGTTPSEPATLTLYTRPKVTVQPISQTLDADQPLTLVAAASGTPAPAYQWLLDGEEIPGATGPTLSIESLDAFDTGAYKVRVTNSTGSVFSRPASVVVRSAPGIAASPEGREVAVDTTVRLQVLAMGFPKLSYQWRFNGEPIPGQAGRGPIYSFKATLARAGVYDVVVTNTLGQATSEAAEVIVFDAPRIRSAPSGAKLRVGQSYQLAVVASGFPAPSYQWLKNGQELEGQTGPTLNFASLTLGDEGAYSVRVGNIHGVVTTKPVDVLVSVAPFSAGTRSTFRLNGTVYSFDGDSAVVNEKQTFTTGKVHIYDYDDGTTDHFSSSYTRVSATQGKFKFSVKESGGTYTVTYVFNFTSTTGGSFSISAYAKGYGIFAEGGGTFTYAEPGL